MRILMKVSMPVDKANSVVKDGSLGKTIQSIIADLNPEAAYFTTDDQGRRCGYLFVDVQEPSQIPAMAEPWFLALNAAVELAPAMKPEDLLKAEPHFKKAAKKYGGR